MTARICILAFARLPGIRMYIRRHVHGCMYRLYRHCLSPASSVQVIQGLRARSSDHCAEHESEVCATKSADGLNPYFVHNIYVHHSTLRSGNKQSNAFLRESETLRAGSALFYLKNIVLVQVFFTTIFVSCMCALHANKLWSCYNAKACYCCTCNCCIYTS